MKTVAIIQARMSSTRLPGKIMADINGKPMLFHVVSRAQQAKSINLAVVATSAHAEDDTVWAFCRNEGILCFRGSLEDVLDRYYQAARYFEADVVVRLTADCPLLDSLVIDKVVQTFHTGPYDYASNTLEPTYPDGLDTEVFLVDALTRAWQEARLRSERENVTSYIWKRPEIFRLVNVKNDVDLSGLRWTVDEPQDLAFVRSIFDHMNRSSFGMAEILNLLQKHPEWNSMNSGFMRNEGYLRSLCEDNLIEPSKGK
jgi:spore coat polysaccharide biosynthesis protein SpsF